MCDYAIKVENLGKAYTIRHQQPQRYATLRDVMADGHVRMSRRDVSRCELPGN